MNFLLVFCFSVVYNGNCYSNNLLKRDFLIIELLDVIRTVDDPRFKRIIAIAPLWRPFLVMAPRVRCKMRLNNKTVIKLSSTN